MSGKTNVVVLNNMNHIGVKLPYFTYHMAHFKSFFVSKIYQKMDKEMLYCLPYTTQNQYWYYL